MENLSFLNEWVKRMLAMPVIELTLPFAACHLLLKFESEPFTPTLNSMVLRSLRIAARSAFNCATLENSGLESSVFTVSLNVGCSFGAAVSTVT